MEWRTSALCILLLALTGSILVNAKRVYASNHVNNICSMWGNFHFKTFDGDTYQFKGTCEYNLVSDCQSLIHQFSVHVQRKHDPNVSKIGRVSVTINDIAVVMTENLVMVNEEKVTLPVHVAGILVEENSIYTKLYSKLGISVMWNREDAVMVELDSIYSNRTCGLCGDFNGVPVYNEFIQSGRRVGYAEFGNMHRVPNPNHFCEDPFENDDEQNAVDRCEKHQATCENILKKADWSSCSWVLSPEPYIRACVNDLCWRQPGETDITSLCSTLSEYSRQCSHAGATPPTWRRADFCPVKCPFNMVHSESGSPCMDTCSHKDTNTLCEEHQVDGCFCPPGTVFDDISNTGCVPVEQCQCKHDRIYSAGEVLQEDGEECVCEGGQWICKSLPSPGLCAVEEGSHFITYDGKQFTFHGDCNYVLSKDCENSKFIILGQLVPCFNHETDTCLKSIVMLIDNDVKNPLFIKADGTVQHNAEVSLPYNTADFTVFRPSSFHIMLQTTFGLQVQVQLVPLMQVYITVDQSFQGKTCGLCGNFNKVLSDDLKTPQGMVEGTAVSFANAWKAQSNCPDRTERMDDPCSYSSDSEHFAEHWCSKLREKESLFAKCHASVNPDSYYKRCKYSSCACEKSEDCLCAVFSSYARACAAKGIFLQGWRQIVCEKYTENCPASQNYSYQLQTCQHTCQALGSERQGCSVDFVPVDGCACPDGLYQDERGLCVPMEKCPCYHNGLKVQPGRSISIRDEHCVCMNGKFHCRSWKARVLGCSPPKVFFNCSTAGQNEHGLECAQTCSQQQVDCFSLDCESGCKCPIGHLDDGRGNCVKPHECPCSHNGQFYAPGAEITRDCNKCTCQRGTWKCTEHKCPGICTIYGSGHYQTFDQQRFGFRGDCSYIAVQDKCGNNSGHFHVITENMPCGTTGTTCSKAVDIILGRTKLKLYGSKVTANDIGSGPLIKYKERKVGMYLVIDAENGLTVLWDRITTVRIILQPRHTENVCGLCGNFNGNGKDDFTTQGNLQTTNIVEFVDSWKASSNCPDSELDIDPCQSTPNRHTWAKIQCSIIKEVTFKDCHSKVDPNPYYENCVKDSCACDTGGDCECFCTAVAAYAQACNEAGVCVVWRTPEICPVYCDYYNNPGDCTWHYSPCHTPCYKTCLNPEGICNNTLPNLEGCYPQCPEDKPIFDEKNQICVEECNGTCYINGTEYNPGEEIPTDVPCHKCICDEYGQMHCFQRPGCCYYNGTEYEDNEVIYDVSDGMGMCYYAICINNTVIETQQPCTTTHTTTAPTSTITSQYTSTTPTIEVTTTPFEESTTSSQTPIPPTVSTTSPTPTKTTTTTGTPPVSSTTPVSTSTTKMTESLTTTPFVETESTTAVETTTITGVPIFSTTSLATPGTTSPCIICEWSEWFDVYQPKPGAWNDYETYENIIAKGEKICEHPEDIECRAVGQPDMSFEDYISATKQVAQCNVSYGLVCEEKKQTSRPYKCVNYEIRVLCCFPCSTPSPTTTQTSTTQTPIKPVTSTTSEVSTSSITTTTGTPPVSSTTPESTSTTTVTESTTSTQTPKPPTVSTTSPTPTKMTTTTGTPPVSSTTPVSTSTTTVTESTTSTQTPKPPTVSTSSPTPTKTTTTTGTPPVSSTTPESTSTTTVTESTTSTQTPKPPTVSTSSPTPTKITTTTGTPPVLSTTPGSTSTTSSTQPPTTTIPSTTLSFTSTTTGPTTTPCVCVFHGQQYRPGDTIFNNVHIGSGVCLTIICSDICEIQNTTTPCPTTPTPSASPSPTKPYDCPEWDKNTNETFVLCNCTMARCIEDNIIEIIPFVCPPLENITCANGKDPVLVYDENYCCQHYACDCVCEGWGDPHYITFDGLFYSYQGNCTYILMEEIRPQYHLKIYIDNVYCDPIELVSCPRSIIVSYNHQVITLTNHNLIGGADLEASMDNEKLRLPFTSNGVRVISSSLDLFLEIPQLGVIITFGATGFGINLPFQHFGNNTQGHCGTCNNNRADDCMLPGGILVEDCAVMADYWPADDINGEICLPPTALPTVGASPKPTVKPCQALPDCNLLNSELFEACHPYVSPENFFLGCEYDSCHMSNPGVVCTSLQTYARTCSQFGICINWRNFTSHCNIECPADKIFKSCGPAEPPTCEDQPEQRSLEVPTEGCFCPDGTMLFNKESGVCVDKCGCLDSSGTPREFDEVFEYNCEECVCDRASKSVICKPRQCLDSVPESCTLPGFVLVNITDPSDPCCTKQVCNCDVTMCPPSNKKCGVGYSPELEVPEGKCCPEIKCVPKKVCVFNNNEYEPGSAIPVVNCQECTCTWDVDPTTELFKISCRMMTCNEDCDPGYEYREPENYKDCCGKCVQTHCILNVNGTEHILQEGAVLPTADQGCDRITCTKVNGQFITDNYRIQCPPFNISNCQPGTVQVLADGCCNVCVDKIKGCQVQIVNDFINHNGCQSERKMDLTFCGGDCASYSRYTEPGSSACSCCQATHTSNRTVSLRCLNGDEISHTYVHVEQCVCGKTDCHGTGFSQQALVENTRRRRNPRLG